jgi:hypothetical protein
MKKLTSEEFDRLRPEQQNVYEKHVQNKTRNELREIVMQEGGEKVQDLEEDLHFVLRRLLDRCKEDPELLDLLKSFLGELGTVSSFGNHENPLSPEKHSEIRAVLVGAAATLEGYRDSGKIQKISPMQHAADLHKFLNLVQKRVGKIEEKEDGTRETSIRIRVNDNQAGDVVKYKKNA